MNSFIRRKTSWEIRRSIVLAPEMTSTQDCGVLLLGVVLVWMVYKRKCSIKGPNSKFQRRYSHDGMVTLARYVVYWLLLF